MDSSLMYCIKIVFFFHCRQSYGEGLQWAGCVIMTLLGQEKRFSALDFCYHLLNVHQVDNQDGAVQGYVSLFYYIPITSSI